MVAFHYPPAVGSSGVQRTLKFSNYLVDHGWHPAVLTVRPFAYRKTRPDQIAEISDKVSVIRTLALDASRHLAINGSYPSFLGRPDPWINWVLSALPAGLRYIRKTRPQAIWSTYPFASAHVIASLLHRLTGVPWIGDFRDLMVEDDYPENARMRQRYRRIEADVVRRAAKVVVTTPASLDILKQRYAQIAGDKWHCIRNGYDEESFAGAVAESRDPGSGRVNLVHSGILYPSERDPSHFFAALAELKGTGAIGAESLQVTLRSTGHDDFHARLLADYDVADIVKLAPGVAYRDAIAEMVGADGLLLFQASNCNHQIPAKLYEYFRAGKPILALTDPEGDTARTMQIVGAGTVVRLDDKDEIVRGLNAFIRGIEARNLAVAEPQAISRYSRRNQAAELAALLDGL